MTEHKDFIMYICHRAFGDTYNKQLLQYCKQSSISDWAIIKDHNKYTGVFSFWLVDDEEKETLYKVGTRSIDNALTRICNDPILIFEDEDSERNILWANKYKDVSRLTDEEISMIIQVAVFGGILD